MTSPPARPESPIAPVDGSLFDRYRPLTGIYDEFRSAEGLNRFPWQGMVDSLVSVGSATLKARWNQAQKQIAEDGVTFNPYGDDHSRPWLLDPLPLVLDEPQWNRLSAGLSQRARLLELVLKDLFGRQHLLREHVVPPDVLYGNPSYFPAYHDMYAHDQLRMLIYGVDLARSPTGEWWVTGDRTRSPFGLGYALENRVVTSRMLPETFRDTKVLRLAPFFVTLQETLRGLAPRFKDNPRIVLWTKGPKSNSYFEDAYLARYLGYTLAEGDDLAVRHNHLMLKTLGSLLPVEVLLRRLDDEDCDPVELRPTSSSGVSGLLDVLRQSNVAVVNSLGSRIVESPILMAFLPNACRYLLGEELQVPSVATWWCGERSKLDYVLANFDRLLIRHAYRVGDFPPFHPATMLAETRQQLIERIRARPQAFIAQEQIQRSTTPVWNRDQLEPWRLAMRTFLTPQGDGFVTLPGGLARVSADADSLDGVMSAGERSQDVWVLTQNTVEDVSLLPSNTQPIPLRRTGAELPSRVADHLYWLGRYAERTEWTARVLRVMFLTITSEIDESASRRPLLQLLVQQEQLPAVDNLAVLSRSIDQLQKLVPKSMLDATRPRGLRASMQSVARTASVVRDRIAVDMYRSIRRVEELCDPSAEFRCRDVGGALVWLDEVLTELLTFGGLAAESMVRTIGWRFLDMGRRLERATQTAALLSATAVHAEHDSRSVMEMVLRISDSLMTYRTRYLATMQLPPVLDLLMTDETNPRSIAYQLAALLEHVEQLPHSEKQVSRNHEQVIALSLTTAMRVADVFELGHVDATSGRREGLYKLLLRVAIELPKLHDLVSGRFLTHAGLSRHFSSAKVTET